MDHLMTHGVSVTGRTLDRAELMQLVEGSPAPLHLEDCDLEGADLSRLDLRGARFERCALAEASFVGATLAHTSWIRCRARQADFASCDLRSE
ncbi:MAG: pentapeptide repeat-containing protein, partial [Burkholderia sp.]|nr:pentapeptide repeat-containing protein [Burkholderia sp.]